VAQDGDRLLAVLDGCGLETVVPLEVWQVLAEFGEY
jgi:hypothetical protein